MGLWKPFTGAPWRRREMSSSSSKTPGKILQLVRWELEKTFSAPLLAIMLAVALYLFIQASSGGQVGGTDMFSVADLRTRFAPTCVRMANAEVVSSFTFSSFIFAAIASLGFSRDIASGYMRVLLSYPIGRARLFLVKFSVLLIVPFLVFSGSLLFTQALIYSNVFWHVSPTIIAYVLLVMLIQMVFMLAVSVSVSLHVRQPIMAFLASVVTLIGVEQVSNSIAEPYQLLVPRWGTDILMTYGTDPSFFASKYSFSDLFMPIIGMIIFPIVISVFNLVYFKWRFQI